MNPSLPSNPKFSLLVFLISLVILLYFVVEKFVVADVYKTAFVGAIYEMLWLPMLLLLVIVPVCSVLILLNKQSKKGLALISFLLSVGAIVILFI